MLYRVVGAHLAAFLDAAAHHAKGARSPAFVEQEFRGFLRPAALEVYFTDVRVPDAQRLGAVGQGWGVATPRS